MMFLSTTEIYELTKKRGHAAQVRALRAMGVDHKVRADGSPAVLKLHVEKIFGGNIEKPVRMKTQPNWNAFT